MICTKCKLDKEESRFEFRKDRQCFRTVCKDCKNIRSKQNYQKVANKISERRKVLRGNNKEFLNEKARERYWKNRDQLLEKARKRPCYTKINTSNIKKWREFNKHKCAAHQHVVRALKNGKLSKPENCQVCGSQSKLNAHHHDYQLPLSVIWLCITCHRRIHSKHFNTGGV